MAIRWRLIVCAAALAGVLPAAGPAAASRATCDELLAALDSGGAVEEVARAYATTRARVEACTNVAQQHERQAERRDRFERQRTARALAH